MTKRFVSELKSIVDRGDTSREYRNLLKKIVRFHRESFTEENWPTSEGYLREILENAIETRKKIEATKNTCYHDRTVAPYTVGMLAPDSFLYCLDCKEFC